MTCAQMIFFFELTTLLRCHPPREHPSQPSPGICCCHPTDDHHTAPSTEVQHCLSQPITGLTPDHQRAAPKALGFFLPTGSLKCQVFGSQEYRVLEVFSYGGSSNTKPEAAQWALYFFPRLQHIMSKILPKPKWLTVVYRGQL